MPQVGNTSTIKALHIKKGQLGLEYGNDRGITVLSWRTQAIRYPAYFSLAVLYINSPNNSAALVDPHGHNVLAVCSADHGSLQIRAGNVTLYKRYILSMYCITLLQKK